MEIAIKGGLYDVAHLLLCNGYRLDLEPQSHQGPLDRLLERRDWSMLELLIAWGADIKTIAVESILDTYDTAIIERFWAAGLDYTRSWALARYMAEHSSNRPLYGWARRHRDDPRITRSLNAALVQAVWSQKEKIAHLLLWAGADPRAKAPVLEWERDPDTADDESFYTAMDLAVGHDRSAILRVLKPKPELDNFDALYAQVTNPETLKYLLSIQEPTDWTQAMVRNIEQLSWTFGHGQQDAKACLDLIASRGGRIGRLAPEACADIRQRLLKLESESDLRSLLRWLADPECCEPNTYAEITRTPSMKAKISVLAVHLPHGRHPALPVPTPRARAYRHP
jgi:hypothetical protein